MTVLFGTHPEYLEHDTGLFHPESSKRLEVVSAALSRFDTDLLRFRPTPATATSLMSVHEASHIAEIRQLCLMGGGPIDADTSVSYQSYDVALLAAGAGLDAISLLQQGKGSAAFVAVRPPGHHATSDVSMGFCVFNNIAIAAKYLLDQGERVLILDFDAHHGNGTQEIFYGEPSVLYVSIHQYPLYPGTGKIIEIGEGLAAGTTINIPVPPRTNGATALAALDLLARPSIETFQPTWLLISAGFDGHRADPLTDLGYGADDFYYFTKWALGLAPAGRTIAFLEGGYDLAALAESTIATMDALLGADHHPDPAEPPAIVETELLSTLQRIRENVLKAHHSYLLGE